MSATPPSNPTLETESADSSAHDPTSMKATPDRALTLLSAYTSILSRIRSSISPPSTSSSTTSSSRSLPRLVCVSKLKPATDILALHGPDPDTLKSLAKEDPSSNASPPALHFGENYLQELLQKSHLLPPTIKWHFIGGLQSNKCVQLARKVPGLWAVESVDSVKKADGLNRGWGERLQRRKEKATKAAEQAGEKEEDEEEGEEEAEEEEEAKLRVFIQVNTSGEESKSGVPPDLPSSPNNPSPSTSKEPPTSSSPLLTLSHHILHSCPHLHLQGLMTIGSIARSQPPPSDSNSNPSTPSNPDFTLLSNTRATLAPLLNLAHETDLELSMGMSSDFETAIRQGSDEVRVGSTIFGERPPKGEARAKEDVRTNEGGGEGAVRYVGA